MLPVLGAVQPALQPVQTWGQPEKDRVPNRYRKLLQNVRSSSARLHLQPMEYRTRRSRLRSRMTTTTDFKIPKTRLDSLHTGHMIERMMKRIGSTKMLMKRWTVEGS